MAAEGAVAETPLARLGPIATARLDLRRLRAADAVALQAVTDDPAIAGAISFLPLPFTLADAAALIARAESGEDLFVGVWENPGELAGVVGVHLRGGGEIEIGYWIGRRFQGSGYAAEAAGAVIGQVRAAAPGRRIVAQCRPGNAASLRVLDRLGFVLTDSTAEWRRLVLR
ncbi:MAG TPA: GNAT family N-acetyltransferase [Stellaceae bacterium]|nr:GNAT family N-acetyltransferase [Stellaceae bacterium]